MSKHEIEVEGLPDGWEPVAYKDVHVGENILTCNGIIKAKPEHIGAPWLIVKQKQPRRIVLEETDFRNIPDSGDQSMWHSIGNKWWREVKETKEPNLCLSVEECEHILRIAALPKSVEEKIELFLRNNNKTS